QESKALLDLHTCEWELGAKVTVALSANELDIQSSSQSFTWNGKWEVLRFDVLVPGSIQSRTVTLKFDVFIEGLIIARLRPEIKVGSDSKGATGKETLIEMNAPRTAFASYSSKDRREVLARVRSLQIFTGVDVFLDCLSIRPGERWMDEIKRQILQRE